MRANSEIPITENPRECLKSELRVYYGPSHAILLNGFSVDISSGGLFLKTEIPFSVDERLLLRFTLPDDSETISCRAKVAWVNLKENLKKPDLPQGIGIEFLGLSEDGLKSIQTFLEHIEIEPIS